MLADAAPFVAHANSCFLHFLSPPHTFINVKFLWPTEMKVIEVQSNKYWNYIATADAGTDCRCRSCCFCVRCISTFFAGLSSLFLSTPPNEALIAVAVGLCPCVRHHEFRSTQPIYYHRSCLACPSHIAVQTRVASLNKNIVCQKIKSLHFIGKLQNPPRKRIIHWTNTANHLQRPPHSKLVRPTAVIKRATRTDRTPKRTDWLTFLLAFFSTENCYYTYLGHCLSIRHINTDLISSLMRFPDRCVHFGFDDLHRKPTTTLTPKNRHTHAERGTQANTREAQR